MDDQEGVNLLAEEIEHSTLQMSADGRPQLVQSECRVMILGRTGSGKSTLGNKLLGRHDKRFTDYQNAEQEAAEREPEDPFFVGSNVSTTKNCQFGTTLGNGIPLTVVDTPGLFDTAKEVNNEHVQIELTRGLLLVGGEPHAFIVVVELGRVTQEIKQAFQACIKLFGTSHVIVAFSKGEQLEDDDLSIEEAAELPGNDELKAILEVVRATGMYVVVTKIPDRRQAEVDLLMEKVNEVSDELRNPWSDPKLKELALEFQRKVESIMQTKNCSMDIATIEARTKIVKWNARKKLLLKLTGLVGLFIVGGAAGLLGLVVEGAVLGGILLGSSAAAGATVAGGVAASVAKKFNK